MHSKTAKIRGAVKFGVQGSQLSNCQLTPQMKHLQVSGFHASAYDRHCPCPDHSRKPAPSPVNIP